MKLLFLNLLGLFLIGTLCSSVHVTDNGEKLNYQTHQSENKICFVGREDLESMILKIEGPDIDSLIMAQNYNGSVLLHSALTDNNCFELVLKNIMKVCIENFSERSYLNVTFLK